MHRLLSTGTNTTTRRCAAAEASINKNRPEMASSVLLMDGTFEGGRGRVGVFAAPSWSVDDSDDARPSAGDKNVVYFTKIAYRSGSVRGWLLLSRSAEEAERQVGATKGNGGLVSGGPDYIPGRPAGRENSRGTARRALETPSEAEWRRRTQNGGDHHHHRKVELPMTASQGNALAVSVPGRGRKPGSTRHPIPSLPEAGGRPVVSRPTETAFTGGSPRWRSK